MKDFKEEDLEIKIQDGGKNATIIWLGRSRGNPTVGLTKYFDSIIKDLLDKTVHVEFKKLEFMSSSTVVPIIAFIKSLEENNIKATITYNKDSEWQCASFNAFQTIAQTMKYIKVEGS